MRLAVLAGARAAAVRGRLKVALVPLALEDGHLVGVRLVAGLLGANSANNSFKNVLIK